MTRFLDTIEQNRDHYIAELCEFLKIPSVSAKSEHKDDCNRAAHFLLDQFKALGFEASLRETAGNPIVLAKYHVAPEKPTLLIYGHYDVQPPEPLDLWHSPPF